MGIFRWEEIADKVRFLFSRSFFKSSPIVWVINALVFTPIFLNRFS